MVLAMMHDVFSYFPLGFVVVVPPGVQVPFEARKIAARNFKPDAMTGPEVIASSLQVNLDFVSLPFLHPNLLVVTLPVACPQNSFVNVVSFSIRIDINQLRREIGVIYR